MGMTFRELIDYAKKEEASDVHVTEIGRAHV